MEEIQGNEQLWHLGLAPGPEVWSYSPASSAFPEPEEASSSSLGLPPDEKGFLLSVSHPGVQSDTKPPLREPVAGCGESKIR